MTTEEKKSGINRRDLIKKGAVAGAVFWSVPVIESVTSVAAAGSLAAMTCSYGLIIYSDTSSPLATTNYYLARFGQNSSTCGTGANAQLSFTPSVQTPSLSTQQTGVTITALNTWSNVSGTLATVKDIYGSHNITTIDCRGVGTMTTNNTVNAVSDVSGTYYFLAAFAWNYNTAGASTGQVGTDQAPGSSITSSEVVFGTQC